MQAAINPIIDTHCHINFADFDQDRDEVIQHAAELGVTTIIVPAVSQSRWNRTIDICNAYSGTPSTKLLLALGMHPMFIDQHQPHHLAELDQLITEQTPVAVGEIGLDFYQPESDRDKQTAYFTKQLIIAKRHHLPVIIHNRKAHDECIRLLSEHAVPGGIIHAFNGSIQQAEKYLSLGFLLGFGGMLTFERSTKLRALVRQLPLQSIVLETDAPDMTVSQHRGARNSPEYLPYVLSIVAELNNTSEKRVAQITSDNVARLLSTSQQTDRPE